MLKLRRCTNQSGKISIQNTRSWIFRPMVSYPKKKDRSISYPQSDQKSSTVSCPISPYRMTFNGISIFLPSRLRSSSPIPLESSTHEYLSIKGTSSKAFLMGTNRVKQNPSNVPLGTCAIISTFRIPWGLWGGRSAPKISWNLQEIN